MSIESANVFRAFSRVMNNWGAKCKTSVLELRMNSLLKWRWAPRCFQSGVNDKPKSFYPFLKTESSSERSKTAKSDTDESSADAEFKRNGRIGTGFGSFPWRILRRSCEYCVLDYRQEQTCGPKHSKQESGRKHGNISTERSQHNSYFLPVP